MDIEHGSPESVRADFPPSKVLSAICGHSFFDDVVYVFQDDRIELSPQGSEQAAPSL